MSGVEVLVVILLGGIVLGALVLTVFAAAFIWDAVFGDGV